MKKFILLLTAAVTALAATACSSPRNSESLSVTGMYFDTVVTIEAWGTDMNTLNHCMEMCRSYEQLLSAHIETSEISAINHAEGQPVTVSEETAELIKLGCRYGRLSGGLFDITIAPASSLWDFHDSENHDIPDAEELSEAVSHIDYRCVQVNGCTVTLTDPEAAIDLGGIAKGYIADRIKEYLESEGVKHALINLGGNMLAVGGRYDGTDFQIGIQKPFSETGTVLASVSISGQSVVSSGNYERYFEKDGKIYHHILDPSTGYPADTGLNQVTIISDSSAQGDALSTTCFLLGLDKGMELIRSLDGVEAVFVTDDMEIHVSSAELPVRILDKQS